MAESNGLWMAHWRYDEVSYINPLTAFLALKCVCFPQTFQEINKKSVAYGAVCSSLLLEAFIYGVSYPLQYDQNPKLYASPTWFSHNKLYALTLDFIYTAKTGLCIPIFHAYSATAISESAKLASMTTNAKKNWTTKRRCA